MIAQAIALAAGVAAAAATATPDPIREARVALAAGRNDGAPGRPRLRFAEADAARFAGALAELGGVLPEDLVVLAAPDRTRLFEAFGAAAARIAQARAEGAPRAMLLFFWSGHAGESGLELGAERVGFEELRALLDGSGADVRVAFVDACKAGALTAKGARASAEGFSLSVTGEASPDGTAIVTSSAPGEDALESAELRGGFFTHHLTSGLRGAADADADGRVTLLEAYRYAYARTVAQTAEAGEAPQHPTYALALKGKGDLVLAQLARAQASLEIPRAERPRRWLVAGESRPDVVEVRGLPERTQRLALAAGRYRLVRADDAEVLVGAFELAPGDRLDAARVPLAAAPYATVAQKGLPGRWAHAVFAEVAIGTGVLKNFGASSEVAAGYRVDLSGRTSVVLRGAFGQKSIDDAGFRYRFDSFSGQGALTFRIPVYGFELFAGPLVGVAVAAQRLDTGEASTVPVGQVGLLAGLAIPIARGLMLRAAWEAVGHGLKLNDESAMRFTAGAGIGLEYEVAR